MKKERAAEALAALGGDTRLEIVRMLARQGAAGMSSGEIAARLSLAPATLSFHLGKLSRAGLLHARHRGKFTIYSPDPDSVRGLIAFIDEHCSVAARRRQD